MVARLALKEFTGVDGKESTISIVWSVIDGAVENHFFLIDFLFSIFFKININKKFGNHHHGFPEVLDGFLAALSLTDHTILIVLSFPLTPVNSFLSYEKSTLHLMKDGFMDLIEKS